MQNRLKTRGKIIKLIFILIWIIAFIRVTQLQVVKGEKFYRKYNSGNLIRTIIPAKRGTIKDRNGRILARDVEEFTLYVDRRFIKDYGKIGKLLQKKGIISKDDFVRRMENTKSKIVTITRGLDNNEYNEIKDIKGLFGTKVWGRFYPNGYIGRTIIGGIDYNRKGISGVEKTFDKYLKGKDGSGTYIVNLRNKFKYIKYPNRKDCDPVNGMDVVLTIDLNIQYILDDVLRKTLKKTKADRILGVAMDGETGEILASVNLPELGENKVWQKDLLIQWAFEPGSVFKIIPALAYIRAGYPLNKIVESGKGKIKVGNKIFKDLKKHSPYTFRDALIFSSNVGFVKIGETVGAKQIFNYSRQLGLGTLTGISIDGEVAGEGPKSYYKNKVDLANLSFGQGILVTPVQLMVAYQSIGNKGIMIKPLIIKKIINNNEEVYVAKIKKIRRVVDSKSDSVLVDLLRGVVRKGTGREASVNDVDIIGKTGTAQQFVNEKYSNYYVSSFIGIVEPNRKPLIIGIFVDNPKGWHEASIVACPSFRRIVKRILNLPEYRSSFIKELARGD